MTGPFRRSAIAWLIALTLLFGALLPALPPQSRPTVQIQAQDGPPVRVSRSDSVGHVLAWLFAGSRAPPAHA